MSEYLAIFDKFNKLWAGGEIDKPLVILIGGYCGSGKSTVAGKIQQYLPSFTIIPTGIIRAIHYKSLAKKGKIFNCHTYDLYKYSKSEEELFGNYIKQARSVFESIVDISLFSASEKQNFIIEGNHILPELVALIKKVYCFDLYLKEENDIRLISNMQSVNHKRVLTEEQIITAVKLNRFLIKRFIQTRNKSLFNLGEDDKILKYVAEKINEIIGKC